MGSDRKDVGRINAAYLLNLLLLLVSADDKKLHERFISYDIDTVNKYFIF